MSTYVTVTPEMLQQFDLSQGPLGQDLLAEYIGDLLNGDAISGLRIGRSTRNMRSISRGTWEIRR